MVEKITPSNGHGFKKGAPRPPKAGRKKGVPNKLTATIKEAVEQAFNNVGGVKWLEKLAETDPKAFSVLLSKLIPTDVKLDTKPVFTLVNAIPLEDDSDGE